MNYPPYPVNKGLKFLIFGFFVLIFLITAPGVTLYTAGYRFDWQNFRITKSGVLSIDVEPRPARVSLDGTELPYGLPIRLPNLSRGTYHVRIERDGFYTWEKNITIEENKTTYIKDIHLFEKFSPTRVLEDTNILEINPAPSGQYLLVKEKDNASEIWTLFDTVKRQTTPLIQNEESIQVSPYWSPKGEYAVLQTTTNPTSSLLFVRGSDPQNPIRATVHEEILSSQWKNTFTAEDFLLISNTNTYSLSRSGLSKEESRPVTSSIFFRDETNTDWYFEDETKSLRQRNKIENSIFVGENQVEQIIDINSDRAILLTHQNILVVPRNTQKEMKRINGKDFFFESSRKEFLVWSPWEIWRIYENGETALLNRMSESIRAVAPLDEQGNIFISTENKLIAFNPVYYTSTVLLEPVDIKTFIASPKERSLYFFGTFENTEGLFELKY